MTMTQPSANRRAHPRYELHLSAAFRLGETERTATTRDLSEGGACIELAYALSEGAELDLALFVVVNGIEDATTPPLRTRARVQWTAENEDAPASSRHLAGLKFEAMTDAQRAWLQAAIARAG